LKRAEGVTANGHSDSALCSPRTPKYALIFDIIPHAKHLSYCRLTVGAINIRCDHSRDELQCPRGRDKRCRQGTAACELRIRTINDTISAAAREQNAWSHLDTTLVKITTSNARGSTITNAQQATIPCDVTPLGASSQGLWPDRGGISGIVLSLSGKERSSPLRARSYISI